MSEPYPPPSYAAHIWIVGDEIRIGLPEAGTLVLPLSRPHTLSLLVTLLRERERAPRPTIGQRAAPVKWDVENALASDAKYKAWLTSMEATATANSAERAANDALLAELGL